MEANFPFARSLMVLRKQTHFKKADKTSSETHYYISSADKDTYSPAQWINLIRGHWGGVEIRNHWKRDAIMGEDKSRTRKPNILANLALIRSALLARISVHFPDLSLPQVRETLHSQPRACLKIISS
jgi:predicted transposase YbfD/YdcC